MTNQLKEKLLAYGTKAEPFTVHNHIRVTDLQDGEARVELTLQPESLNRWGTAHGGILFALADIAAGTAVLTLRQEVCLTVNASIDFLDAAGLGSTLIAVGHVDRMGKSLCFCHTDKECIFHFFHRCDRKFFAFPGYRYIFAFVDRSIYDICYDCTCCCKLTGAFSIIHGVTYHITVYQNCIEYILYCI